MFYTRYPTSCGSMLGVEGDVDWPFFTVGRRRTRRPVGAGTIVIKPGPGVDPTKGPGPGFQGSTRVNPD